MILFLRIKNLIRIQVLFIVHNLIFLGRQSFPDFFPTLLPKVLLYLGAFLILLPLENAFYSVGKLLIRSFRVKLHQHSIGGNPHFQHTLVHYTGFRTGTVPSPTAGKHNRCGRILLIAQIRSFQTILKKWGNLIVFQFRTYHQNIRKGILPLSVAILA